MFYSDIISAIKICASSTVSIKPYNIVPGCNEYVKEHHLHAKDALWWWNLSKKPRLGPLYETMRTTRAQFKYALRFVKKQEDSARADSLARDLYDNDVDSFWKAMPKMNSCNNVQANVIDGITGQENITDYWKEHFDKILNANDYDHNLTANVSRKLQNVQHNSSVFSQKVVTRFYSQIELYSRHGLEVSHASNSKFFFQNSHY